MAYDYDPEFWKNVQKSLKEAGQREEALRGDGKLRRYERQRITDDGYIETEQWLSGVVDGKPVNFRADIGTFVYLREKGRIIDCD